MGFFDALFGRNDAAGSVQEVGFGELGSWFKDRTALMGRERMNQAQPVLKSIRNTVKALETDVGELDSKKLSDNVEEHFAKIIRTNKPGYVKDMMRALKNLESSLAGIRDLHEFNGELKAVLDVVGKANFGGGRYLFFVYNDEMRRIQSKCRLLLDAHEKLSELVKAGEHEERLLRLRQEYEGLSGDEKTVPEIRRLMEDAASRRAREECELVADRKRLEEVTAKKNVPEVVELEGKFESALSGKKACEAVIHSSIARISRGLRKYGRQSASESELIRDLIDNPVECFLRTDHSVLVKLFEGVEDAVRQERVKLKDKEKTLSKITDARRELSAKLKEEYIRTTGEASELRRLLDEKDIVREENKLRQSILEREKTLRALEGEVQSFEERLGKTASDIEARKLRLATALAEMGVRVTA